MIRIHDITRVGVEEIDSGVYAVVYRDAKGREYTHEARFAPLAYNRAAHLAARVRGARWLNEAHWACHVGYGCEAWLEDGYEQRQIEDEMSSEFD